MATRIAAPGPQRGAKRKPHQPLYGLWRESRLAHLDFAAIEVALADLDGEWKAGLDIIAPENKQEEHHVRTDRKNAGHAG